MAKRLKPADPTRYAALVRAEVYGVAAVLALPAPVLAPPAPVERPAAPGPAPKPPAKVRRHPIDELVDKGREKAERDPSRLRTRKLLARCHVAKLGAAARLVLVALQSHENSEGHARPSGDLLAVECGMDRRTARRALRQLEAAGLIEMTAAVRRSGRFTQYVVADTQHDAEPDPTFATAVRDRQTLDARLPR